VNSAPDTAVINLPPNGELFGTGGTINLSERQRALMDWVIVSSIAGNALYDIGENKEWMWNTTGSFYQAHMSKYHENSSTTIGVTTGH